MAASAHRSNVAIARGLGVVALLAFGFGFALVPLYDVFCELTGVNGKPGDARAAAGAAPGVDRSRSITVELMGTPMPGASWDFYPTRHRLVVHPGEIVTATYVVKNPSDRPITGQAVPSVSPSSAAPFLQKLDCFCFRNQELAPGAQREMPVTFYVSPDLPARDTAITLSYAFFPVPAGPN